MLTARKRPSVLFPHILGGLTGRTPWAVRGRLSCQFPPIVPSIYQIFLQKMRSPGCPHGNPEVSQLDPSEGGNSPGIFILSLISRLTSTAGRVAL